MVHITAYRWVAEHKIVCPSVVVHITAYRWVVGHKVLWLLVVVHITAYRCVVGVPLTCSNAILRGVQRLVANEHSMVSLSVEEHIIVCR